MLSVTKKIKEYGCVKCGTPFKVNPPDDLHTTASRDEKACQIRGVIKMDYICAKCGATNTIHWCRKQDYSDFYHT
jgi:DNA-directed RNA polymerase subunit RPC12/RpoP